MSSTPEFRKQFVARLEKACDDCSHIPPKGEGRQQVIAERLHLAAEAVSKWFKAISMPRPEKMRELANLLGVDHAWLAVGDEPEVDRAERRVRAKQASGAVHLVWGHISLDGGHCGELPEGDPRREYVDFTAILRGSVLPMHICLGREVAVGQFEMLVPREFAELRVVGVIPAGPGKYHFIEMPAALIDKLKQKKGGFYAVTVGRSANRYVTESAHWPRINSFAEWV